jgi:hypothetical protein
MQEEILATRARGDDGKVQQERMVDRLVVFASW